MAGYLNHRCVSRRNRAVKIFLHGMLGKGCRLCPLHNGEGSRNCPRDDHSGTLEHDYNRKTRPSVSSLKNSFANTYEIEEVIEYGDRWAWWRESGEGV